MHNSEIPLNSNDGFFMSREATGLYFCHKWYGLGVNYDNLVNHPLEDSCEIGVR
jgi:hypothetical protein